MFRKASIPRSVENPLDIAVHVNEAYRAHFAEEQVTQRDVSALLKCESATRVVA